MLTKKFVDSSDILRENLRIALIEASDLDHIRNWEPVPNKYSTRVIMITSVSDGFLRGKLVKIFFSCARF